MNGSARIIQAPNSDVILHVPDGVHALIQGNIHTDHSKFALLVADTECIVSPVCEYNIQYHSGHQSPREPYKLQVPHIVKDPIARKRIKVQVQENPDQKLQDALKAGEIPEDLINTVKMFYTVKKNYVEIFTNHFCNIVVTTDHIECCGKSVRMMVFSRMINPDSSLLPRADVDVQFASVHSEIQDYEQVYMFHCDIKKQFFFFMKTRTIFETTFVVFSEN